MERSDFWLPKKRKSRKEPLMDIEEKSFTTEWTPIEKEGNPKKAGVLWVWWMGGRTAARVGMAGRHDSCLAADASTVYRQRKAASQDMGLTIPEQRRQRERRGYQHEHNTGICHTLRKSRLLWLRIRHKRGSAHRYQRVRLHALWWGFCFLKT